MLHRRELLRRSALLSLSPLVPGFLARTADAASARPDSRVLVVIQLDGGNDGINTVVPFGDEAYKTLRRELRLPADKLHRIAPGLGLHPSMRAAADLLESGRLAIVQGVSYPNPNRSHFESMAIWQTARLDRGPGEPAGWLGRALDAAPGRDGPAAVFVGEQSLPRSLFARRAVATSFADASDLALTVPPPPAAPATSAKEPAAAGDLAAFVNRTVASAYATATELEAAASRKSGDARRYPETDLARRLELVARSIKCGCSARVYYLVQPGYDTHAVQLPGHAQLLREFSGGLRAFLDDLAAAKLADRVLVIAFSEFGRRPAENGSLGTDHGTAGPVFVAGAAVKPGLVGQTPLLGDLKDGDLKWGVDFRRVYATLLDRWLDVPSVGVLGSRFEALPLT
jgi:uncharacterized protein (DUF1501 family)